MAKVRLDAKGRRVKPKAKLFKQKGKSTPHKTHSRHHAAKKKKQPKKLFRGRVEAELRKGGYY